MSVISRGALALAAASFAAIGLAPGTLATASATGTGGFAPGGGKAAWQGGTR